MRPRAAPPPTLPWCRRHRMGAVGRALLVALFAAVGAVSVAEPGAIPDTTIAPGLAVLARLQQLSLSQLEALYSMLDDDGSGDLTVHEMIVRSARPPIVLCTALTSVLRRTCSTASTTMRF